MPRPHTTGVRSVCVYACVRASLGERERVRSCMFVCRARDVRAGLCARMCASTCARSIFGSSFTRGLLPALAAADGIGGRGPHHHHTAPKRSAEARALAVPRPHRQRYAYERAACCGGVGCRRRGKEASSSSTPRSPMRRASCCALASSRADAHTRASASESVRAVAECCCADCMCARV